MVFVLLLKETFTQYWNEQLLSDNRASFTSCNFSKPNIFFNEHKLLPLSSKGPLWLSGHAQIFGFDSFPLQRDFSGSLFQTFALDFFFQLSWPLVLLLLLIFFIVSFLLDLNLFHSLWSCFNTEKSHFFGVFVVSWSYLNFTVYR